MSHSAFWWEKKGKNSRAKQSSRCFSFCRYLLTTVTPQTTSPFLIKLHWLNHCRHCLRSVLSKNQSTNQMPTLVLIQRKQQIATAEHQLMPALLSLPLATVLQEGAEFASGSTTTPRQNPFSEMTFTRKIKASSTISYPSHYSVTSMASVHNVLYS